MHSNTSIIEKIVPLLIPFTPILGIITLDRHSATYFYVCLSAICCFLVVLFKALKTRELMVRRDPTMVVSLIFSIALVVTLAPAFNLIDAICHLTLITSSILFYWYLTNFFISGSFLKEAMLPALILCSTVFTKLSGTYMLGAICTVVSLFLIFAKNNQIVKLAYGALFGLNLYMISGSRTAVIGVFIGSLLVAQLLNTKTRIVISLVAMIALALNIGQVMRPINPEMWSHVQNVRTLFLENPVLGIGSTNFQEVFARYNLKDKPQYTEEPARSLYLMLLSEGGLVLFIAFCLIMWVILRRCLFFVNNSKDEVAAGCFGAVLTFFAISLVSSPMQKPYEIPFLFIFAALTEHLGNKTARFRKRSLNDLASTILLCGFIVFAFLTFFVAKGFIADMYLSQAKSQTNIDQKINTYKTALDINPFNKAARFGLARSLAENNQGRDAIIEYNFILENLHPYHIPSLYESYKLYEKLNETDKANKKLRRAKEIMPFIKFTNTIN